MTQTQINPNPSVDTFIVFGKTRLYLSLIALVLFNVLYGSQAVIDSLSKQLETDIPDVEKAGLLFDIAMKYYHININEAIHFAEHSHKLFKLNNRNSESGKCLNLIGAGYYALGDFNSAEIKFTEALKLTRQSGDSLTSAKILSNLANIKLNTGYLVQAVDYFTEAGIFFSGTKNRKGILAVENSLASIYRSIGSYSKAHAHLKNALRIADESLDRRILGIVYQNLGSLLIEEEKYREALDASLKSLAFTDSEPNRATQIKSLINLGSIYYETDKSYASDTCYNNALTLARQYGYAEEEAYILMHLGYVQFEDAKYITASDYFIESMKIAREINDIELQTELYSYLYLSDSIQGKMTAALVNLQKLNHLDASLNIDETEKKLEELENLYLLAKEENIRKEKIIFKNHTLIIGLIAGMVILGLIMTLIIQRVHLRSQRKISELSQENLRSQMNPHFIFNILNSIHSFILSNNTTSSSNYLLKFSRLLRLTLDNSRNKLASIQDELNALKLYLDLESMRFENKLEYSIVIDDEIDPQMFKIPTLLLQPYVENSLVHGLQNKSGKGKIEVKLDYLNKGIHCSITDNGIGRTKAEILKHQSGKEHKSHGTTITETRLKLLNTLYKRKFGVTYSDILDEENNCTGTKVEFDLPILN